MPPFVFGGGATVVFPKELDEAGHVSESRSSRSPLHALSLAQKGSAIEHPPFQNVFVEGGVIILPKAAGDVFAAVKELLGEEWLNNELFRLGTSRLANLCLSEITGESVKFF